MCSSLARPDQLLHGHWKTPDIQVNSAGPTCSLVCRQWGANIAPLRTILEADYVLSCRSLFHSVDHAGVLGLLIHNIKNEVDRALKVQVVLVLYSVLVVQCNFLNFKSRTYYLPHISLCLQRQSLPTVHSLVLT